MIPFIASVLVFDFVVVPLIGYAWNKTFKKHKRDE
jgi:hypothetical protein